MANNENNVVMSFIRGFFYPLKKIDAQIFSFLYLTTLLSFIALFFIEGVMFGQKLFCSDNQTFFCSPYLGFSVFCFIYIVGLAFYINRWFLISNNNISFKEAISTALWKKDIQTSCFVIVYLFLWGILSFSANILSQRIPDADWRNELMFFIAISGLIVLAVYFLVNAFLFIRFLQGKKWFCLKETFWPVLDNLFKIIGWFLLYLFIFMMFFIYALQIRGTVGGYYWINEILSYFFVNFLFFSGAAIFVSLLEHQANAVFHEGN